MNKISSITLRNNLKFHIDINNLFLQQQNHEITLSGNLLFCQTSFEKQANAHTHCENITPDILEKEILAKSQYAIFSQIQMVLIKIKYDDEYFHSKYDEKGNWQINIPIKKK